MIISFNFNERTSAATRLSTSYPLDQSRNLRDDRQSDHREESIAYYPPGNSSPQLAGTDLAAYEVYAEGTFTYLRYYYENIHPSIQQVNFGTQRIRDNLFQLGLVVGTPLAASLISGLVLSDVVRNTPVSPEGTQPQAKVTQDNLRTAPSTLSKPTPASPERLGLAQSSSPQPIAYRSAASATNPVRLASLTRPKLDLSLATARASRVALPATLPPASISQVNVAAAPATNTSLETGSLVDPANLPAQRPASGADSSSLPIASPIAPVTPNTPDPIASVSPAEITPAIAPASVAPPEQLPLESSGSLASPRSAMLSSGTEFSSSLPAAELLPSAMPNPKAQLDLQQAKASLLQSAHLTLDPLKLHQPVQ